MKKVSKVMLAGLMAGCLTMNVSDNFLDCQMKKVVFAEEQNSIIVLTSVNFLSEVKKKEGPLVIDVSSKSCAACEIMEPRYEELAMQYAEQIRFASLDGDLYRSLVKSDYTVTAYPTFLLYLDGKLLEAKEGILETDSFEDWITSAFGIEKKESATETPTQTEEPKASDTPETTQEVQITIEPDSTKEPEESVTPEKSTVPEETKLPEETTKPEESGVPELTTAPKTTITPEITATPKVITTPKVTTTPTAVASQNKVTVSKVKISGVKRLSGKKIKLTYKKIKNADGYEIVYADNKSFSGKKKKTTTNTSYTLKNLNSKKTYYIKVRAYTKSAKGKKSYGTYSKIHKVKKK